MSTTAAVAAPQPQSLGAMIDALQERKDALTDANRVANDIKAEITELERQILQALDDAGMPRASGQTCSVVATDKVVPTVEDWDAFYQYVSDNHYFHLLQRRVSATAAQEFFASGEDIPGVKPTTLRALSARRSNTR